MTENNDKENSEREVPLTRQKGQKHLVDDEVVSKPVENITITKPTKEKKPRSEKQKAQFEQVFNKRKELIEKKKLEKKIEASRLLLQHDPDYKVPSTPRTPQIDDTVPDAKKLKPKKEPKIIEVHSDNSDDDDSDESVIIIKKKSKTKKSKKKKIVIEESSEESSSGEDEEVIQLPKPKRDFTTQQNKKSIVKVHEKPKICYDNYFC